MFDTLRLMWAAMAPGVLEFVGVMLMLVLTWAARRVAQVYGLTIEERHRQALHTALMSGLQAALTRRDSNVIASAIDHAKASTPDAIAALRPADGVMHGIVQGMYGRLPPGQQRPL